jgi:hypothetical protein|nr:MAG TPA: hypothetical protein [Caudoviricetes sp.]
MANQIQSNFMIEQSEKVGMIQAELKTIRAQQDSQTLLLKEMNDKLDDRLSRDEFNAYKHENDDDIRRNYLQRHEVESLLNTWKLMTSMLGKIFISSTIIVLLYVSFKVVIENQIGTAVQSVTSKEGKK